MALGDLAQAGRAEARGVGGGERRGHAALHLGDIEGDLVGQAQPDLGVELAHRVRHGPVHEALGPDPQRQQGDQAHDGEHGFGLEAQAAPEQAGESQHGDMISKTPKRGPIRVPVPDRPNGGGRLLPWPLRVEGPGRYNLPHEDLGPGLAFALSLGRPAPARFARGAAPAGLQDVRISPMLGGLAVCP